MKSNLRNVFLATSFASVAMLSGCGGGGGSEGTTSTSTTVSGTAITSSYAVGGSVTGLTSGNTLRLLNNGGNSKTISADGTFAFGTPIASGATYAVTVASQPTGQTCTVTNGSGTVGNADVTTVSVACSGSSSSYNVGIAVSGLVAGTSVVLQNNGSDNLTAAGNASYNFNTPLTSGAAYAVTVLTQPLGQTCTVASGSGNVGTANVSVAVSCVPKTYSIGGTVSGLGSGKTVSLRNNGGNTTSVSANGSFAFSTALSYGSAYGVAVSTQPVGQNCVISNASGTVPASNVTNVNVNCATTTYYNVNATVSGLAATTSFVAQNNGGDNLSVTANGTYTFSTTLASGSPYSVSVLAQPSGQTCSVTNGNGTMGSANITASITCTANSPSADLCSGVANTGKSLVAYSNLPKPALYQAVTDPNFGTTIRRITDVATQWPGATVAIPAYPTIPAWNADETYLLLYVTQPFRGWALLNGKTYALIKMLDINPADVEQFYWDRTNPDLIYYVDQNSYVLTRMHVSTGAKDTVHNFATDIASGVLKSVCTGADLVSGGQDPFFMSYDNDLIGLGCRKTGGANTTFEGFSYRLSTNTIGPTQHLIALVPQAAPSGTLRYLAGTTSSKVLDATTNTVIRTVAWSGEEHSDMMKNAAGDDLVAGVQYDGPSGSGTLMVANLTKGTVSTIIGEAKGDPYPPTGTLVSGKAFQKPGWVAVGATGNGLNVSNPAATYLTQEILLANVDTGSFCRLAHHRSFGYDANSSNQNYWAQPNVILSPRGTRILFPSDWYKGSTVDTYVIELPTYVP